MNFEHVTLTVTFDLLLKNFIISRNFLILRDRAFVLGMCVPCDNFEHVTLTFDLLLKNFIISRNFLILRDRAFVLGMCVSCDKALQTVPKNLKN